MAVLDFGGGSSPYLPQSSRKAWSSDKVLRLKICRDDRGTWSVQGLSPLPAAHLPSLSASLDYARRECAAAPATIELEMDGFYAVVHQEDGWPRPLIVVEAKRPLVVSHGLTASSYNDTASVPRSRSSRFIEWRASTRRLIAALASGFVTMKRSKSVFS
jgi:hypothetical protein